jgi:uncharacterized protein (TIGR02231 family)
MRFLLTLLLIVSPVSVHAAISRVTVYPDRAEVVRQVEFKVAAGASQIEFEEIPSGVEPDSIRLEATGVPTTLGQVTLQTRVKEAKASPEWTAADLEVRQLQAEGSKLDQQKVINVELRGYLNSLKAAHGAIQSETAAHGKLDPAALQQMLTALRTGYTDLATRDAEIDAAKQTLAEQLKLALARRKAAESKLSIESRVARVEIVAAATGTLRCQFSYVVPGASWRPAYRATLEAEKRQVELISEAVIFQNTGEDWNNVELLVSTAAPSRGIESPVLESWYLRPYPIAAARGRSDEVYGAEYQNVLTLDTGVADVPMPQTEAAIHQEAQVVETSYSISFQVPGKSSIASGQAERRVPLKQQTLPVELAYRTVPSVQADAFAVAITTLTGDAPLLAGPMRVIAGSAYVGSFTLPETAPGSELRIPFGVDNRVKVTRTVLPQKGTREGLVGRDRQVVRAFRTTIENLRDLPITIVLEERVPISEEERIKVEISEATTPGSVELKERPGVLNWKLELKPKEKRDVTLEYAIRHPRDLPVNID